ncbi:unnamed protein product [Macrosiphum euphorbiae]|uniref:THAP9-like helix-turn-helix domain-containing protein n=1 Tax=Macrosiphum euphorbiae TaxID=13131 RepID=A0AAV0W700_9HEMI|nr:unnamed protein product [Macrosiphum euphorbiae]
MIPDPKIKSKVIRMSIEEVLTSAEDADISVAKDHDQKSDRENTSELIDNTQILPDSQDQETVLGEVLGETLYTPIQKKKVGLDTENILTTPSRFKVKRPLFSPSPKCKKVAKIDSPNTMSLKKTIKNLQQGIRRKDKKIKNLVGLIASMSSKGLIDNQSEQLLTDRLEGVSKELFSNELLNKGRKATGFRYSKVIKEFAITLNYYSPKALKYCR